MAENSRWDWLLPRVLVRASKGKKIDNFTVHQSDDESSTRKSKRRSWYSWYGMWARDNGGPVIDKVTTTATASASPAETAGKRKRENESTTTETLTHREPKKQSRCCTTRENPSVVSDQQQQQPKQQSYPRKSFRNTNTATTTGNCSSNGETDTTNTSTTSSSTVAQKSLSRNVDSRVSQVSFPPPNQAPSREEMKAVYTMCRENKWESVLERIRINPLIPTTILTAKNNLTTSILHQAIISKGDTKERARVIQEVLRVAPLAALMKNHSGSLPIHCISQRNTKMDFKTKERLIRDLMNAYPESLAIQNRSGMKTPLHIILTGTFWGFVIFIAL